MKKVARNTLAAVALLAVAAEVGIRFSGLVDFPVYHTDAEIGYMPEPSQQGQFLNKNDWVFNDKSMGVVHSWSPSKNQNIVLIGNSIVMGGNPYAQRDKLGPLLQARMGGQYAVWPVAAGGWTNVNESVYLQRNPDVSKAASFFVWEYMQGGLSTASAWRGEYVFPTQKPVLASWYVLRRYVLPKFINFDMNELPPTGAVAAKNMAIFELELSKIASSTGKKMPGILFIYPVKQQYLQAKAGVEWLPEREQVEKLAKAYNVKVVDISSRPEWNEAMYREETHPTVKGNEVLADILASEIQSALR
jgi:hypothetical protein